MRAVGSFRVLASQQKVLSLHDPVDAIMVNGRSARGAQLPVPEGSDPERHTSFAAKGHASKYLYLRAPFGFTLCLPRRDQAHRSF